jgi:hypothetical protein
VGDEVANEPGVGAALLGHPCPVEPTEQTLCCCAALGESRRPKLPLPVDMMSPANTCVEK